MHKGATGVIGECGIINRLLYIYPGLLKLHIGSDVQSRLIADTVAIAEVSPCIQSTEIVLAQGYPIP